MSEHRPAWLMTPAELAQIPLPETPPEPTAEEARLLVARLNTTEGPSVIMNAAEVDYIESGPPVRYAQEVERLRRALDVQDDGGSWVRGVRAALDYAAGALGQGPLTGRRPERTPPTQGDLGWEVSTALDALAGDLDTPLPHDRDYITAVEHTCMWLRGTTAEPPITPA